MKTLSNREIEIIRHMASGHTAKEIARKMDLTPKTIENYIVTIRQKLVARNVAHAVYLAGRARMLDEVC